MVGGIRRTANATSCRRCASSSFFTTRSRLSKLASCIRGHGPRYASSIACRWAACDAPARVPRGLQLARTRGARRRLPARRVVASTRRDGRPSRLRVLLHLNRRGWVRLRVGRRRRRPRRRGRSRTPWRRGAAAVAVRAFRLGQGGVAALELAMAAKFPRPILERFLPQHVELRFSAQGSASSSCLGCPAACAPSSLSLAAAVDSSMRRLYVCTMDNWRQPNRLARAKFLTLAV